MLPSWSVRKYFAYLLFPDSCLKGLLLQNFLVVFPGIRLGVGEIAEDNSDESYLKTSLLFYFFHRKSISV